MNRCIVVIKLDDNEKFEINSNESSQQYPSEISKTLKNSFIILLHIPINNEISIRQNPCVMAENQI